MPDQPSLQQSAPPQKEDQSGMPNYSTLVTPPPLVGQQSSENAPEKEASDVQK